MSLYPTRTREWMRAPQIKAVKIWTNKKSQKIWKNVQTEDLKMGNSQSGKDTKKDGTYYLLLLILSCSIFLE